MKTQKFNQSYIGKRPDILRLIPTGVKNVLDVGCSTGALGASIKEKTKAKVVGVELSKNMAVIASSQIDEVIIGDIENEEILIKLKNRKFDVIIFADVLEHLRDPWTVLKKLRNNLQPQGVIITSIPNIRHIDTIINLLFKGYWPYRKRGIHDATHLRFFTRKNILEMFENANFYIEKVEVHYRIIERPHILNRCAKYFAFPILKEFLAFQYLVVAHKK